MTYCHTVLTPVRVKPGADKVIPLAPEFVQPQDGDAKQDGELNAARRWLEQWGTAYALLGVTVLGDDGYCHEPFCRALLADGFQLLLVCKPDSHPEVYEWVEFLERSGALKTHVVKRWTGKGHEIDTHRYVAAVPLRAGDEALTVPWCELTTTDRTVLYRHAVETSHPIEASTVAEVVAAGRTRWKIANENTLNTKGDHFEHHYGHGQQHLSSLLATRILLAYRLHTLLAWIDDQYGLLRQKPPSRQRLLNDRRALTTYLY